MELEEYRKKAMERLNPEIVKDPKESMYYACMGLAEEKGEIIAEIRKALFKGNFHEKEMDLENIKSEIGDLMWYLAFICNNTDINMNEINKDKGDFDDFELPEEYRREEMMLECIDLDSSSTELIHTYKGYIGKRYVLFELKDRMKVVYSNVIDIVDTFGLNIQEILDENVEKINSRYDKNGKVSIGERYE